MALRTPLSVTPHLYMGDSTGRPLDMGTVYFGEQDKDPEFYPINLFSDDALTLPLAQPVHTKGGYLYDKGDMVEPHAKEIIYSVKVLDSYGRKVFYKGAMMRNSWNDDVIEQINAAIIESQAEAVEKAEPLIRGAIDKAILEMGYVTIDSFELGANITQRNQALRHTATGKLYRWAGDLPKVVTASSTPTSSGGFGDNAWIEVSDATLRQELASPIGGSALLGRGVVAVDSFADLNSLPADMRKPQLRYLVQNTAFIWRSLESEYKPLGRVNASVFGIVPDTGVSLPVVNMQAAVDYCSLYKVALDFEAGEYIFNQTATTHDEYVLLEMKPYIEWNANNCVFKDLLIQGSGYTSNVTFNGGRFYNSVSPTKWLMAFRGSNFTFNDVHFDQDEALVSFSPWLFINNSTLGQPSNYQFNRCNFTNRSNIFMWNFKNVEFNKCLIHNITREDGIVVKARKGLGAPSNLRVNNCTLINTTGCFAVGTELGEDASNLRANNCTLINTQHVCFLKPNDSVTSLPELRGGNVSDVKCTNTTLHDTDGENFISPLAIRVSDGSVVSDVELDGLTAFVRCATSSASAALSYRVNAGTVGSANNIKLRRIKFTSLNTGAVSPNDTDIDGVVAKGYAVDSIVEMDSYTITSDSLSDVFIEGEFRGVAKTGVTFVNGIAWGDIKLTDSIFTTTSPRGAIVLANADLNISSLVVDNLLTEKSRLVSGRISAVSTGALSTKETLAISVSDLIEGKNTLIPITKGMLLNSIKTVFSETIAANASDYVTFSVGVMRKGTSVITDLTLAPAIKLSTAAGINALTEVTVWESSRAHVADNSVRDIILNKGDTLVLSVSNTGAGATIPNAIYSLNYVNVRVS